LAIQTYDEALATPSEFAQILSLRTAQILEHETKVTDVVDPLGGSYYVEWLTNKLEEEAQKMIDKLEELGGACRVKACSWFYGQMRASAAKYQKEIDSKERIVVGVNEYVMDEKDALATLAPNLREYDPTLLQRQIDRLNKVRRERDKAKAEEAKKILSQAFKDKVNIMPPLIEAVKAYISGGEVIKLLMEARGEQYGPRGGDKLENELELALFTYH
jgi:methylmalonyl-CoA mutase N-terminal domain/subunit